MPAYPPDTNLEHTRETDGYDGVRKGVRWWFEAWNIKGGMVNLITREANGKPPRPRDLQRAKYIIVAMQFPDAAGRYRKDRIQYRTHTGGLDV